MMKNTFFVLLLASAISLNAQTVSIQDQNFREVLVKSFTGVTKDDAAQTVTFTNPKVSDITSISFFDPLVINEARNIRSFKGIEAFKELTQFALSDGLVEEIDLTQNEKIQLLQVWRLKNAKTLLLGNKPSLTSFWVSEMPLREVDLRNAPSINMVIVDGVPIENISFPENNTIQELYIGGTKLSDPFDLTQFNSVIRGSLSGNRIPFVIRKINTGNEPQLSFSFDPFTQLVSLKDNNANTTIRQNETGAYLLGSKEFMLNVTQNRESTFQIRGSIEQNPTLVGALPPGIESLSNSRYWVIEQTGSISTVGLRYNLIVNVGEVEGNPSAEKVQILYRPNKTSAWKNVESAFQRLTILKIFPNVIVNDLTAFGEFAIGIGDRVIENTVQNLPRKFELLQNTPNPFNPTTTIRYNIPSASRVELKIYDLLGREVATLENGVKEAGVYTIPFNGNNLASGIYFYKLVSGSFTETKKMMLIK
ncbi:MAG: T9SS type A sorting domain-containing protein [Chloroherpetonaceae bacterium]|nr:T9SS type A sorting domain-containing protein [Chloroherpetonaceae bacterium]